MTSSGWLRCAQALGLRSFRWAFSCLEEGNTACLHATSTHQLPSPLFRRAHDRNCLKNAGKILGTSFFVKIFSPALRLLLQRCKLVSNTFQNIALRKKRLAGFQNRSKLALNSKSHPPAGTCSRECERCHRYHTHTLRPWWRQGEYRVSLPIHKSAGHVALNRRS